MTGKGQSRSFLLSFCVFLAAFRHHIVNSTTTTIDSTALLIIHNVPISPVEGSYKILDTTVLQILQEDTPCLDCIISVVFDNSTHGTTSRFVNATSNLMQLVSSFSYEQMIEGEIAFVVNALGGDLEYTYPIKVTFNNQTITKNLNISVIPLTISAYQSNSECSLSLDLLTNTLLDLSRDSITVTMDQVGRLPEVTTHIIRPPSFGTIRNKQDSSILPSNFSYTLFIEKRVLYEIDDPKTRNTMDSFDIQFSIGHGISAIVTVTICLVPLPYPMLVHLGTLSVFEWGMTVFTPDFLNATQTRVADSDPENVVYDIIASPTRGLILHTHNLDSVKSLKNFTQKQVNDGEILYVNIPPADKQNDVDKFKFRVVNQHYYGSKVGVAHIAHINMKKNAFTIVNTGFTVSEAEHHVITKEELYVTAPQNFVFDSVYILESPKYGKVILKRPDPAPALLSPLHFDVHDLEDGYIFYNHTDEDDQGDKDMFSLLFIADLPNKIRIGTSIIVNISISQVNDHKPTQEVLKDFDVVRGRSQTISKDILRFSDADHGYDNMNIIYTLSFGPFSGSICVRDTCNRSTGFSWTQRDIFNGDVVYEHDITGFDDLFVLVVSDGEGQSSEEHPFLWITVVDIMPERTGNETLTLDEGSSYPITLENIDFTADGGANPEEYNISIETQPEHGSLYNNNTNSMASNFTLADLINHTILYQNDGSNNVADQFSFKLSIDDFTGVYSLDIAINPVDDDLPRFKKKQQDVFVKFTDLVHFTSSQMKIIDDDTMNSSLLQYVVTQNVSYGVLEKRISMDNEVYIEIDRFTQKDIDDENIRYSHTHIHSLADNFTFSVTDGNNPNPTLYTQSIYIIPDNVPVDIMGVTVAEGDTVALTLDTIIVHHPYFSGTRSTITVTNYVGNGELIVRGEMCTSTTCVFTTQDMENGLVRYKHDGREDRSDVFRFTMSWSDLLDIANLNYTINITPVNDQSPFVTVNSNLMIWATETVVITPTHLMISDNDSVPNQLVYEFNLTPEQKENGYFKLNDKVSSTFTQQDINDGRVTYVDTHKYEGPPIHLKFTVHDGNFSITETFNVTAKVVTLSVSYNRHLKVTMGKVEKISNDRLYYLINNKAVNNSAIQYIIEEGFKYGTIIDSNGDPRSSFTQQDLLDEVLSFQHTAVDTWESLDCANVTVHAPLVQENLSIVISVDIDLLEEESSPLAVNKPIEVVENDHVCFGDDNLDGRNFRYTSWKSNPGNSSLEQMLLTYIVTTPPKHGYLTLDGVNVTEFSHDDLLDPNNTLCYHNDGSEVSKDSISLDVVVTNTEGEMNSVSDVLEVHVALVNDELPYLETDKLQMIVLKDSYHVIRSENLKVIDLDNSPEDITYTIQFRACNGHLRLGDSMDVIYFTQADINNGRLEFISNEIGNCSAEFKFNDTKNSMGSYTFNFMVHQRSLTLLTNPPPILSLHQTEREVIIGPKVVNSITNGDRHATQFTVTKLPSHGVIIVNGDINRSSFNQTEVDDGLVSYRLTSTDHWNDSISLVMSNLDAAPVSFNIQIQVLVSGTVMESIVLPSSLMIPLPNDMISMDSLSVHRDIYINTTTTCMGSLFIKYPNTDVGSSEVTSFKYSDLISGRVYFRWSEDANITHGDNHTCHLQGVVTVKGQDLAPGMFSVVLIMEAPKNFTPMKMSSLISPNETPTVSTGASSSGSANEDTGFNLALYVPLIGMVVVIVLAFVVIVGFCCSQSRHIKRKLYHNGKKSTNLNFDRASPAQRFSPPHPPHSPQFVGGFDHEYSESESSSIADVMMMQPHTQQPPHVTTSHNYLPHSQSSYDPGSSGYHTHASTHVGVVSPAPFHHPDSPVAAQYGVFTRGELRSSSPVRKINPSRRNIRPYASLTLSSNRGKSSPARNMVPPSVNMMPSQVDDSSSSVYDFTSLTQESLRPPSLSTPTPVHMEPVANQEVPIDMYRKSHPVLKQRQYWV